MNLTKHTVTCSSMLVRASFACAATFAIVLAAQAQPSLLAPHGQKAPSGIASAPSALSSAAAGITQPLAPASMPPIRVPIKTGVDFAITATGERPNDSYYASIKNIGTTTSAASNLYCAANVLMAKGGSYAIERVLVLQPMKPDEVRTIMCNFKLEKGEFNSAQGALKPGDKIFDVHFIVNNHAQITETNMANNDVRVKPSFVAKSSKD